MSQIHPEEDVRECAPEFSQDDLPEFERLSLSLPPEKDGDLSATLIRRRVTKSDSGRALAPAVLYLHGFVDYFFQEHLANAFESAGFRFYALDLRRYGRSLRADNRANMARSIDEYFTELTWALLTIAREHGPVVNLLAHSTGALTAVLYAKRGFRRDLVRSLTLNSPFFAFNLRPRDLALSRVVASLAGTIPNLMLPQRPASTYGRTLHKDFSGEWDYDLSWKPLSGFPLYASWFRMIHQAQEEVAQGPHLEIPILTLASTHSELRSGSPRERDFTQDIVLNVDDMKRMAPLLGENSIFEEIEGGIHDLVLSPKPARDRAVARMVEFSSQMLAQ